MGIGTSLGAYFDDAFHHQAGIDTQDENEHSSEGIKHDDTPIPVNYLGELSHGDDLSYDRTEVGANQPMTKEDALERSKKLPMDEESYTLPNNPYLWIRKKTPSSGKEDESTPVSSNGSNIVPVSDRIDVYKGDAPKEPPNIEDVREPDFVDKLFGTNGAERYPLWPERMVRDMLSSAHDVGTGKVPMWSMDPETGDMHTSIDGLEAAHSLMPAANGGGFPLKIQLHPEAVDALSEGPNAFQQFMAGRGRSQSSNIVEGEVPTPPAAPAFPVRGSNEDSTSFALRSIRHVLDHAPPEETPGTPEFNQHYGYHVDPEPSGHPMDPETAANRYHNLPSGDNIRFAHNYEEHATDAQWDRYERLVNDPHRQVPFEDLSTPERMYPEDAHGLTENDLVDWDSHDRIDTSVLSRRRIDEVKQEFEEHSNIVVKKGNVSLLKDPYQIESPRNSHLYKFLSDKGIPGELTVRPKQDGEEIYVAWIGTIGTRGPMDVGRSEMKNLFKLLADQYPKAETITGFRVSGARAEAGKTGDAEMKIPGRGK